MNKRCIYSIIKNVIITIGIIAAIIVVISGKMWHSFERRQQMEEIRRQNGENWVNGNYGY